MTVIPRGTITGSQQAYPAMTTGTGRTTIDYQTLPDITGD